MVTIKVVRANRGFWNDLFAVKHKAFKFINSNKVRHTELISNNAKGMMWKLSQLKILDVLGIYQEIKIHDDSDILFSYNRFLTGNKPYILAVENPLAMVHYRENRAKSLLGKMHLKKTWNNLNLRSVVCISDACYSTMKKYYDIPQKVKMYQIYPYIEDNISVEAFQNKVNKKNVECLYISSNFELKGGMELISAIHKNNWFENNELHFTIITKLDGLSIDIKNQIEQYKNVQLLDYKYEKHELNQFYKRANILIHLTRLDSFGLTVLEAMGYGCAVISTKMYAIPEMVINEYNGYLTEPSFQVWNDDNTKNEKELLRKHKKMYSDFVDERIVSFLSEKLNELLKDRNRLKELQCNSMTMYSKKFSKEIVGEKWEQVIMSLNNDSPEEGSM